MIYVSKLTEKVVAKQLIEHVSSNGLDEVFQSAYKNFHSTETALVKVYNDILVDIDKNRTIILLLLDLSAAFDTVDHEILLYRLASRFGISDVALSWFGSYLSNRSQFVNVRGAQSEANSLPCGVPQGSVLGPVLYLLYTSPLGDIVRRYNMASHFYADDTQLYLSFNTLNEEDRVCTVARVESCVRDIDYWMAGNRLKLNNDKTQLLVISSKYQLSRPPLDGISVGGYRISPSDSATNIGVVFYQTASLDGHVKSVCKSALFHLRNIAKIREYLNVESTKSLVHAFVTCRLDNCNSLLIGSPSSLIQNCAARLVTGQPKFAHVTPILKELHWLPIEQRVAFKVLLLAYKGLNGLAPKCISDMLVRYTPCRVLRSSDRHLLNVPKTNKKTYGDRAFSAAAPRLWNSLPLDLKISPSVSIFKSRLKTHLFTLAFN